MDCLYMLAIVLSVLGTTAATLVIIGLINHSSGHDEQ